jgi:type II secretory pathway pseudopilin PulG
MRINRPKGRRPAFTLIELIVVISIIIVIAALGAAFAPRVTDSQNLTRSVDQLEQWLLTAKMRAKRDGLATGIRFIEDPNNPGIRFIEDPNNPGMYSQFQYIQQPERLSGGSVVFATTPPAGAMPWPAAPVYLTGGACLQATGNQVQFANVDFTAGNLTVDQYLVQQGDYLELLGGGIYYISAVVPPNKLALGGSIYDNALSFNPTGAQAGATTNYRILRQPRILNGEDPLQLPNNYAVDLAMSANVPRRPLYGAPNGGYYEILFSPSGAVVGQGTTSGKILLYVHDYTQTPVDPGKSGVVAVQTRTGYIGAYNAGPPTAPYIYAEEGRSSGL